MHLWIRSGKRAKKNDKLNKVGGHSDGKDLSNHVFLYKVFHETFT
jgi:hypothetical protein